MIKLNYRELKDFWVADALNYSNNVVNKKEMFKLYFTTIGFKYSFWLRLSSFLLTKSKIMYAISRMILQHYSVKFGIEISPRTKLGKGLAIAHFGGIVINGSAVIGKNLNIRQGITIGNTEKGVPTIGDNLYMGVGAKIIGDVKIGDNVKVGANAVVTKDVPDNCTAVGIPAKIIYPK